MSKRRDVGPILQDYALWPHMSVRGNVSWPLEVAGMPRAERRARVGEVLTFLDIDALGGAKLHTFNWRPYGVLLDAPD